jgi:curli biogenesis system outer membrane secretion channel CsgG
MFRKSLVTILATITTLSGMNAVSTFNALASTNSIPNNPAVAMSKDGYLTTIPTIKSTLISLDNTTRKQRPRIAILDFDCNAVGEHATWIQGNLKNLNDGLINKLVEGKNYAVIERSKIEEVAHEQISGSTDKIDASTAAKLGRSLGVQAVVIGSISLNIDAGGGGIEIPLFQTHVGGTNTNANFKINARVVDTTTGEILFTAEGNGTSRQDNNAISLEGFKFNSTNSHNESKLLSIAAADAISKLALQISSNSAQVPETVQKIPATPPTPSVQSQPKAPTTSSSPGISF